MRNKKAYGSNYSSAIMVILVLIVVYFSLAWLVKDEFMNSIITTIFIPIFLLIFSSMYNKIDVVKQTFVDLEIYDTKEKLPADAVVWHTMNSSHTGTYCCIKNIGQSLISSVNIIINPSDPQKDKCYRLSYPISSRENQFVELPIESSLVKCIVIIFYSHVVDNSVCFKGDLAHNHDCLIFSELTSVKGYNTRKIENYIELRRNFVSNMDIDNSLV